MSVLGSLLQYADRGFGIDAFGFNSEFALSSSNIVGLPKDWKFGGSESVDGWGRFDASVEAKNSRARVQTLAFSITGLKWDDIASYLEPSSGHARNGNFFFFAHVDGIDGPAFNCSDDAYFAGSKPNAPVPTPLPASAWLLLAGLAALGFALRNGPGRRRRDPASRDAAWRWRRDWLLETGADSRTFIVHSRCARSLGGDVREFKFAQARANTAAGTLPMIRMVRLRKAVEENPPKKSPSTNGRNTTCRLPC